MKFRVDRDVLADGVAWSARALPNRPSVPTLAGLLIAADGHDLTLSGSDYEQSAQVLVDATVDEPGRVLVSGRLLADISRSLPNQPVQFVTEGSRVELTCGRSRFVLPTLPVEEYPALPAMPEPIGVVGGDVFAAAVSQVAIAAGRDDTLPMLLGVRVEVNDTRVTLAATDRYRLAVSEFTWRPTQPGFESAALVPAKILADTAKQLSGAAEVSVAYSPSGPGEGLMGFSGDGRLTTSRLLDGDFPKYRQLLPKDYETTATVVKSELVEAVKRVSLVAQRNTPVLLNFTDEQVELKAGSADDAEAVENIEAATIGPEIKIAFNPQYLLDGLGAITTSEVRFSFTNSTRPAVLNPVGTESNDYTYLLMPVRLS